MGNNTIRIEMQEIISMDCTAKPSIACHLNINAQFLYSSENKLLQQATTYQMFVRLTIFTSF